LTFSAAYRIISRTFSDAVMNTILIQNIVMNTILIHILLILIHVVSVLNTILSTRYIQLSRYNEGYNGQLTTYVHTCFYAKLLDMHEVHYAN